MLCVFLQSTKNVQDNQKLSCQRKKEEKGQENRREREMSREGEDTHTSVLVEVTEEAQMEEVEEVRKSIGRTLRTC